MLIYILLWSWLMTEPDVQSVGNVNDFTLTNAIDGKTFSLSSLKDYSAVAVIFTSNDCPYDKLYSKRIEKLLDHYRDLNVAFVLINPNDASLRPDDTNRVMSQKLEDLHWDVPYLLDKDQKVAAMFGAQKTPEAFVLKYLNDSFQILYRGSIDDNPQVASDITNHYLKQALESTLNEERILVNSTYPTGCMIK